MVESEPHFCSIGKKVGEEGENGLGQEHATIVSGTLRDSTGGEKSM